MTGQTLRAERLGYVALTVSDLDKSLAFWRDAVQLEISEKRDDKVFLRGGMQHHWITLQQAAEPGLQRVGIEVSSPETLEALERRLTGAGVVVEPGTGLNESRILHAIRFNDPAGNPLELYCDMVSMATPPRPISVTLLDIQHCVMAVDNVAEAADFYTGLLGMRVSDWIGDSMFFAHFRNGWHHGLGLGKMPDQPRGLHHICFQPPDLDNVMRGRARVRKLGYEITLDILRHGPSGSVGFYFIGPDDVVAEMSYGARQCGEDEQFRPRQLAMSPETIDVWQTGLSDSELSIIEELRSIKG
ncbi:MAG: VOC family protein [Gammaproteobacteria bacterium]